MKNLKGKLKMSLGQIAFPDVSGNSTKLDFLKILPAGLEIRNDFIFKIFISLSDRFLTPKFLKIRPKLLSNHQIFPKNIRKFFQPDALHLSWLSAVNSEQSFISQKLFFQTQAGSRGHWLASSWSWHCLGVVGWGKTVSCLCSAGRLKTLWDQDHGGPNSFKMCWNIS